MEANTRQKVLPDRRLYYHHELPVLSLGIIYLTSFYGLEGLWVMLWSVGAHGPRIQGADLFSRPLSPLKCYPKFSPEWPSNSQKEVKYIISFLFTAVNSLGTARQIFTL